MKFFLAIAAVILLSTIQFGASEVDIAKRASDALHRVKRDIDYNVHHNDKSIACWHNDWQRRDSACANCMDNRWSFVPDFGGRCFCCKFC
ncbi:hypothetical protein WR25_04783 [Diploscapter pachys]|uniref:Uncharacterized protein n=1 Tax=Diploscapter pachys TaxID=2018661 RepID=A0A2A2L4A5_9BILA|nr:hypothetical protein WR25_04783 [Diploscapter pachys]